MTKKSLIDMLESAGFSKTSKRRWESMPLENEPTWGLLIAGYHVKIAVFLEANDRYMSISLIDSREHIKKDYGLVARLDYSIVWEPIIEKILSNIATDITLIIEKKGIEKEENAIN